MKKFLTVSAVLLITSLSASAWGRLGHAAVAKIAEDHLTPTTKACVSQILAGEHLSYYSSWGDDYKSLALFDFGVDFTDGSPRINAYPHTFEVNMDFEPFRTCDDNGRYVKNCIYFIEAYGKELQDWKELDDSTRFVHLVYMIHWLGDMHCPEHIRYNPEDMSIGHLNVIWAGESVEYHKFWDAVALTAKFPWSFSDLAYLFDTYSEEQYVEMVKGGPWAWAYDSAKSSWPIHQVKDGQKLSGKWLNGQTELIKSQIAKGGYRLAHHLNLIFDARYRKTHQY